MCSIDERFCAGERRCIPGEYVCDGCADCLSDFSDETNCPGIYSELPQCQIWTLSCVSIVAILPLTPLKSGRILGSQWCPHAVKGFHCSQYSANNTMYYLHNLLSIKYGFSYYNPRYYSSM